MSLFLICCILIAFWIAVVAFWLFILSRFKKKRTFEDWIEDQYAKSHLEGNWPGKNMGD
jgi:hypothetical protein